MAWGMVSWACCPSSVDTATICPTWSSGVSRLNPWCCCGRNQIWDVYLITCCCLGNHIEGLDMRRVDHMTIFRNIYCDHVTFRSLNTCDTTDLWNETETSDYSLRHADTSKTQLWWWKLQTSIICASINWELWIICGKKVGNITITIINLYGYDHYYHAIITISPY